MSNDGPVVPIVTPLQRASDLSEAMTRALFDIPEATHDGVTVTAQWVQGQGVSAAVHVQVKNVTGAVVVEKTYSDLRVLGAVHVRL